MRHKRSKTELPVSTPADPLPSEYHVILVESHLILRDYLYGEDLDDAVGRVANLMVDIYDAHMETHPPKRIKIG